MAEVFTTDRSTVGAITPFLRGELIPSIDIRTLDGRGFVVPWGGGRTIREVQPTGQVTEIPTQYAGVVQPSISIGDIINYSFEGLIGPPGSPGPTGPMGSTRYLFPFDSGDILSKKEAIPMDVDVPLMDGIVFSDGTVDSKVKLLLHVNGADEAVSTVDAGDTTHTITWYGTAQLDTAQKKFGTASLLLDGNSDYVSAPDHADWNFAAGEFTVDTQVRFAVLPTDTNYMAFADEWEAAGDEYGWWFGLYNDGGTYRLRFVYTTDGTAGDITIVSSDAVTVSTNTWYHMCVVRDGNTLRFFHNGVAKGTADMTGITIYDSSAVLLLGAAVPASSTQHLNGWLDEVRIIKADAFWTAAFTAPTVPYVGATTTSWSTGTVNYGGTAYTITTDSSDSEFIYWDKDSSPTTFLSADIIATTLGTNKWVMCYNDAGTAYPAHQNKIVHGGLIQASTITADGAQIADATITAATIGALAVETAKINNLAVGTIKIANDATSIYETASTAAESGFFSAPAPGVLLQTRAITSAGGAIQLSGGTDCHNYEPLTSCKLYIYRGAVEVVEVTSASIAEDGDLRVSIFATDFPGSGSHTYYLYGYCGDANRIKATNRDLICEESRGK